MSYPTHNYITMMSDNTAVLLVNLGTPNGTSTKEIRIFLREFLNDPRVIDLPGPIRRFLVNFIIVPFRSSKTSKAYQKIWTNDGSPLLINSRNLQQKLNLYLNNNKTNNTNSTNNTNTLDRYDVLLAMSYSEPKLKSIIKQLEQNNYTRITILPLYPQYASATSGSVLEKSLKYLSDFRYFPKICCINEFYLDSGYINSMASLINKYFNNNQNNNSHLLFSYHGIPERQLEFCNSKRICDQNYPCGACPESKLKTKTNINNKCYRYQCYATTNAIAKKLNLNPEDYSTSFQSRLGKLKWVEPYTEEILETLRAKNITNLTIVCPSFVADCLETLEEIGISLKQRWLDLGGTEFTLIPCLNDYDLWVESLANIIKKSNG